MGSESSRSYPRQIWFVLVMVLILGALVTSIVFGFAPGSAKEVTERAPAMAVTPRETEVANAVQAQVTETRPLAPTLTNTREASPTATASATPPPTVTRTPSASPTPTPSDHYWLARPIPPGGNDRVARFYDYASRADGTYPIHHGVEFVNPSGTPALAVAPGTVVVAGDDLTQVYGARTDFYGKLVIQELDRRYDGKPVYVLYGHLSKVAAEVGRRVETGERIGLVGMTGVAEGPHIHMEVRYGENDYGKTVNPELWLAPKEGVGTLAGVVLSPNGDPLPEVKLILYHVDQPQDAVREVMTYPQKEVNSDPLWKENFATGDVAAGEWLVKLYHKGQLYSKRVSVQAGATSWLTIQTRQ